MQFCGNRWFFVPKPQVFCKSYEDEQKVLSQKRCFCSKSSPGPVKCSLDNLAQLFCQSSNGSCLELQKRPRRTYILFQTDCFFQNVTLDTRIPLLANLPKSIRRKSEIFSLKIWKPKNTLFLFLRKKVPQNIPMDTWNAILKIQAKFSSQKSEFFRGVLEN